MTTSGNDEVEAIIARDDCLAEDVCALLHKQAAQIERVEVANSSLHTQWDSEVKALHAQIAELRRLLRACLDDEFPVGSKALRREIEAYLEASKK